MEEVRQRELQLLCAGPTAFNKPLITTKDRADRPPLDLSLSMSITPARLFSGQDRLFSGKDRLFSGKDGDSSTKSSQIPKQNATEQVRLAALERSYADRVREAARSELELADKEFARARLIWKRARDEVEKVENMKMIATRRISSTCIEITCQACRKHFRP